MPIGELKFVVLRLGAAVVSAGDRGIPKPLAEPDSGRGIQQGGAMRSSSETGTSSLTVWAPRASGPWVTAGIPTSAV